MTTPTRALLIEDNAGDARLIQEMLREPWDGPVELECADRLSTGLSRLAAGNVHVLLLDLSLPDSQGLETFRRAHAQAPEVAIVVLTGHDDEALGTEAVRGGAQDYLVKGQVDAGGLRRAVRYAIERKRTGLAQREAAKLRSVAALAHAAAHEINNPLTVIIGNLKLLADGVKVGDAHHRWIESALGAAGRIGETVRRMTHITKLETVEPPGDLPAILDFRRSSPEPGDDTSRRDRPV